MKVKRSELREIIQRAVLGRLVELHRLSEADPDPVERGDDELKLQKKQTKKAAAGEPPPQEPAAAGAGMAIEPTDAEDPAAEPPDDQEAQPGQADAIDAAGDTDQETGDGTGEVNEFTVGKTVQSISLEEESKVLPGAKEVILAFDQTTEPLRILVTVTGKVAFFMNGQIHDLP